jgi:hypothetical protein
LETIFSAGITLLCGEVLKGRPLDPLCPQATPLQDVLAKFDNESVRAPEVGRWTHLSSDRAMQ